MSGFTVFYNINGKSFSLEGFNPLFCSRDMLLQQAKMNACGEQLYEGEKYKLTIVLPWSSESKVIENDVELLQICNEFEDMQFQFLPMHMELLPLATDVPLNTINLSSEAPINRGINDDHVANDGTNHNAQVQEADVKNENEVVDVMEYYWSEDESFEDSEHSNAYEEGNHSNAEKSDDDNYIPTDEEVFSDYQSEDDDYYRGDSSEDEGPMAKMARKIKGKQFKENTDNDFDFKVGDVFNDVYHFREVLKDFIVRKGFEAKRVKNDGNRVTAKCTIKDCPWRIHASKVNSFMTFQVKTYNREHNCQRSWTNHDATAPWIAKKIEDLVKANPNIGIKEIKAYATANWSIHPEKYTLYRAKRIALENLGENHEESYNKLFQYSSILLQENPGAMAIVKTVTLSDDEPKRFQRYFLGFPAQKDGFLKGCRPFIGVDGCHLKGPYGGILLSAIALDANNSLFPLAIYVCEIERTESWSWFFGKLKEFLGGHDPNRPITFISDRMKGALIALEEHWPESPKRYCARHILTNFKREFPDLKLTNMFWAVSRASSKPRYEKAMKEIKALSKKAYNWLANIEPSQWCRFAFDTTSKSDHVTNNFTESYNSWLGNARSKPILQLLEHIRRKAMRRFSKKKIEALRTKGMVPQKVKSKIDNLIEAGRQMHVILAGEDEYEVRDGSRLFILKLGNHACDCGAWAISGIPCKHAMAAICYSRLNAEDYVHHYFKTEAFFNAYAGMVHPIPDSFNWPEIPTTILWPPNKLRKAGRPKKCRRREPDEPEKHKRNNFLRCGICGDVGHNKRSCKRTPEQVAAETKFSQPKRLGRPRKPIKEGISMPRQFPRTIRGKPRKSGLAANSSKQLLPSQQPQIQPAPSQQPQGQLVYSQSTNVTPPSPPIFSLSSHGGAL